MKYILLILLLFSILSLGLIGQSKSKLTIEQAKEKAELFIAEQGYTNLPATQDTLKIYRELLEYSNVTETLKFRHNMLESHAIGIKATQNGWIVAFRYNQTNKPLGKMKYDFKRYGRAVTMDTFGEKIRIEHKDVILQAFQNN
jgi:hypothetical protein